MKSVYFVIRLLNMFLNSLLRDQDGADAIRDRVFDSSSRGTLLQRASVSVSSRKTAHKTLKKC